MASGQTLYSAGALGAVTPSTGFATLDTRNQRAVLDFDDGPADEQAFFSGVLPAHYSGGSLILAIHWSAESAAAGDVRWTASFERLQLDVSDLDVDDFQTAVIVDTTTASGDGELIETLITLAALDTAVAGDSFRILLERTGSHASDTMVGDAELLDISIKEA